MEERGPNMNMMFTPPMENLSEKPEVIMTHITFNLWGWAEKTR